ncbi:MAG: hypothetical protein WAN46_00395 [Gammaproteobacteria bacterium]|jgi:hypothetical protein
MLSKALQKLSEQALEAFKQRHTQRFRRPVLTRRLRSAVKKFKYDAGQVSYILEPRYVERKEWGFTDQYRFINQEIKTLSSYAYCSEMLSRSFNINREHLEHRLTRYLQVLLSTYFYQQDKSIVAPLSQTFLQDLKGEPIHWAIKGAIRGVALETNQCRFGKYLLRRPVANDFEVEQGVQDTAPHPLRANPPSAILEFATRALDHHAVRQEYAGILNLLRLFRVGSVRSVALTSTPHSIIQIPGVLYSAGPAPIPYVYTLRDGDQAGLDCFLEHHLSCATRLDIIGDTDGKNALICLAFKTYTLAVLGPGQKQSQLLLALACLEALLLRAEERPTVGCALLLRRRLSNLLSGCGAAPESVASLLQQAYDIRAAHRHLLESSAVETRSLTQLAQSILNYARITLIAFLHTPDCTTPEAIIEALDDRSRSIQHLLKSIDIPL